MKILDKVLGKYDSIVARSLPRYFIWSSFASSLYYILFSSKFRREMHAVLVGKVKHLQESKSTNSNRYVLIRNTHRIEKGLLMRPRRNVFALDFIGETVRTFQEFYQTKSLETSQLKWSYDVLNQYFSVTGDHEMLNKYRSKFYSVIENSDREESQGDVFVPYMRKDIEKPQISYDDFYKLTKFRRSVRWFEQKCVPRELLDKAILAANQSPSACNRQPFEFRIIDDAGLVKEVSSIPGGVKGYNHNIPVFIVVVGNLDAYFDERDRHVIYVDASLASMTFMFALETLGLSSCAINWPDVERFERRMEKALDLSKQQRPVMCLAVGYPDPEGMVAYSEKKDLNEIRKYN